jgi:RHS repeat-associated protein
MGRVLYAPGASDMHVFLEFGDHLGSGTVVIDKGTGGIVEYATYLAYGAVESDYRPVEWNSFREDVKFTGKEEDIEVGLTYFGARYYSPYLARFVSADPATIHGVSANLNPYAYVSGNVFNLVDPFGLDECSNCQTQADPGVGQVSAPGGSRHGYGIGDQISDLWNSIFGGSSKGGSTSGPPPRPPGPPLPSPQSLAHGIVASNPGVSVTVDALATTIEAFRNGNASITYLNSIGRSAVGPLGELGQSVVSPIVAGGIAGQAIVIDTKVAIPAAVQTMLAAIPFARNLAPEVRAVGVEVTATAAAEGVAGEAGGGAQPITTVIGRMKDLAKFGGDPAIDTWAKSGRIPAAGEAPVTWAENAKWLTERVARGDRFGIATDPATLPPVKGGYIPGVPNGYFTARELSFLRGLGIEPIPLH